MSITRKRIHLHWLHTLLLAVCLVPAFFYLGLPFKFDWNFFISTFAGIGLLSTLYATGLLLIGLPVEKTFQPLWNRYSDQKLRIVIISLFAFLMFWEFGWTAAVVLTVFTVALAEVIERARTGISLRLLFQRLNALWLPAAYLFAGFVLIFSYNDIVASFRFTAAYDAAFLRLDAWLLGGTSISEIAHSVLKQLSPRAISWIEFVYYRMFPQIGVGLVITALFEGRKEAFRFVATILTSYYLALFVFAIWPSLGPFWGCPMHFSRFSASATSAIQAYLASKVQLLWDHKRISNIGPDFYISFPCMHIVQPLIVLWFLRRWKRIVFCLVIYDILLIPAILLLEWHYVVDLIGGVTVAVVAIALNYGGANTQTRKSFSTHTEFEEALVE